MEKACQRFEKELHWDTPAMAYLEDRGIGIEAVERFRLGAVSSDPPDGYAKYADRLAIPYLDKLGVYGFKFRCIRHDDCKKFDCHKYVNPSGQDVGVFNVLALEDDQSDTLHVCEGEMDAIALSQYTSEPVIGLPGAQTWKDHWACHFSGFERVVCWRHGDAAGEKWAKRLRDVCRNAEVVELPPGEDVNSLILSWGSEKVLQLVNGDEEE